MLRPVKRQLNRRPQFIRLVWFEHIAGRRTDLCPLQGVTVGIGCQINHRHILLPLDLESGFDSVHFPLQYDIHQNQIRMRIARLADRLFA